MDPSAITSLVTEGGGLAGIIFLVFTGLKQLRYVVNTFTQEVERIAQSQEANNKERDQKYENLINNITRTLERNTSAMEHNAQTQREQQKALVELRIAIETNRSARSMAPQTMQAETTQ